MDTNNPCLCDFENPTAYLESLRKQYAERTAKLQAYQQELENMTAEMENLLINPQQNVVESYIPPSPPPSLSMPSSTCRANRNVGNEIPKRFPRFDDDTPERDPPILSTASSAGATAVPQQPCGFFQKMMENAKSILSINKCSCTNSGHTSKELPSKESDANYLSSELLRQSDGNELAVSKRLLFDDQQQTSCLCDQPDDDSKLTTTTTMDEESEEGASCQDVSCICKTEDLIGRNQRGEQVSMEPSSSKNTDPTTTSGSIGGNQSVPATTSTYVSNESAPSSQKDTFTSELISGPDCDCTICKCASMIIDEARLEYGVNIPKMFDDSKCNCDDKLGQVTTSAGNPLKNTASKGVTCICPPPDKDDNNKIAFYIIKSDPKMSDEQCQCAIGNSLMLRSESAPIVQIQTTSTPAIKRATETTSMTPLPCNCNTSEGPKLICPTSGFSLTSDNINQMQMISELFQKEKELKAKIECLKNKATRDTYNQTSQKDTTRTCTPVSGGKTGGKRSKSSGRGGAGEEENYCHCYCCQKSTNQLDSANKIMKIEQDLRLENNMLKSEVMDMKLQLKHCLEKIEGPMKQRLECEKQKCDQLQMKLVETSKGFRSDQDNYTREINDLKMQLCNACNNINELTQKNLKLKDNISEMDSLCAQLEEDLVKQKINEAETIKRLTTRQKLDDKMSGDVQCECSLGTMARKLSKTIKDMAPCEECAQLPSEVTDTAKRIRDLTDRVLTIREKQQLQSVCPACGYGGADDEPGLEDDSGQQCCICRCNHGFGCRPLEPQAGKRPKKPDNDDGSGKKLETLHAISEGFMPAKKNCRAVNVDGVKSSCYPDRGKAEQMDQIIGMPPTQDDKKPSKILPCAPIGEPCKIPKPQIQKVPEKLDKSCKSPCSGMLQIAQDVGTDMEAENISLGIANEILEKVSAVSVDGKGETTARTLIQETSDEMPEKLSDIIHEPPAIHSSVADSLETADEIFPGVKSVDQREIPFTEERTGIFPYDVQTKAYAIIDKEPPGLHITTATTGSGNLEVITEGPEGTIETNMVYTESGNIEVVTKMKEFKEDEPQQPQQQKEQLSTSVSDVPVTPDRISAKLRQPELTGAKLVEFNSSEITGASVPETETPFSGSAATADLTSHLTVDPSSAKRIFIDTTPPPVSSSGITPLADVQPEFSSKISIEESSAIAQQPTLVATKSNLDKISIEQTPAVETNVPSFVHEAQHGPASHIGDNGQLIKTRNDQKIYDQLTSGQTGATVPITKLDFDKVTSLAAKDDQKLDDIQGVAAESFVKAAPLPTPVAAPLHSDGISTFESSLVVKEEPITAFGKESDLSSQVQQIPGASIQEALSETVEPQTQMGITELEIATSEIKQKPIKTEERVDEIIEAPKEESLQQTICQEELGNDAEEKIYLEVVGGGEGVGDLAVPSSITSQTIEPTKSLDIPQADTRKTRDCSCQSISQINQSCQCCECKEIGTSTSGDKQTITELDETMCIEKPSLPTGCEYKEDMDSDFVTISEVTANEDGAVIAADGAAEDELAVVKSIEQGDNFQITESNIDLEVILDDEMLKKHPELIEKSREEQMELMKSLGYITSKSELEIEVLSESSKDEQQTSGDGLAIEAPPIIESVSLEQPLSERQIDEQITLDDELLGKQQDLLQGKSPDEQMESVPDLSMDEILAMHPELADKSEKEQREMLKAPGYAKFASAEKVTEAQQMEDARVAGDMSSAEEQQADKIELVIDLEETESEVTDKKPSDQEFGLGDASTQSATRGQSISSQKRPSCKDDSTSCKAICRTVFVQSSAAKVSKEFIRSGSTTSSASELSTSKKQKRKSGPGEVPAIVSELSDKQMPPPVESVHKLKVPRRKRSGSLKITDCIKCDCLDPCSCVVCSPKILESRRRALSHPCDCSIPKKQISAHPPGCICSDCYFDMKNPCPDACMLEDSTTEVLKKQLFGDSEPVHNGQNEQAMKIHPSNCECVDCLCMPKVTKLANTKEYPYVFDTKQIYQVKVKCDTCENAQNARRYVEQQRSRIPISTTSSNPPRARSKDAGTARREDSPQQRVVAVASSNMAHSLNCTCTLCVCSECPDLQKGKPTAGKSDDCCCDGTCICQPCTIEILTQQLKDAQAKLVDMSGPMPSQPSADISHDEECNCPDCTCPGRDLVFGRSEPSPAATDSAVSKPSESTAAASGDKGEDEECTCPTCECPFKDSKGGEGRVLECDCKECQCAPCSDPKKTAAGTRSNLVDGDVPCDCKGECQCSPCADTQRGQGGVKDAGIQRDTDSCDCIVCFCDPCEDPNKITAVTQQKLDAAKTHPSDCNCMVCECFREIDAAKEIMIEFPKAVPHPPDCDCDECKCIDEIIQTELGAEAFSSRCDHPDQCRCPICRCIGEGVQTESGRRVDTGVQLPQEKEVHALDCVCQQCVCVECDNKATHVLGCKCIECVCSPCEKKGLGDATGIKSVSPPARLGTEDCTCTQCYCDSCSDPKKTRVERPKDVATASTTADHPEGCNCIECLCKECLLKLEPMKHQENCQCPQCVCIACLKQMAAQGDYQQQKQSSRVERATGASETVKGDEKLVGDNCVCKLCMCIDCKGVGDTGVVRPPTSSASSPSSPLVSHDLTCTCDTCICSPCSKPGKADPGKSSQIAQKMPENTGQGPIIIPHDLTCTCDTCTCSPCSKKSTGGQAQQIAVHGQPKPATATASEKISKVASQEVPPFEVPIRMDCDCRQCACLICTQKAAALGIGTGGPVGSSKEAPPFEVPIRIECDCKQCNCIVCSHKGPIPQQSRAAMVGPPQPQPIRAETQTEILPGVHPLSCDCPVCVCTECKGIEEKKSTIARAPSAKQVGGGETRPIQTRTAATGPARCDCPTCTCEEDVVKNIAYTQSKQGGVIEHEDVFQSAETLILPKPDILRHMHPPMCDCDPCKCVPCQDITDRTAQTSVNRIGPNKAQPTAVGRNEAGFTQQQPPQPLPAQPVEQVSVGGQAQPISAAAVGIGPSITIEPKPIHREQLPCDCDVCQCNPCGDATKQQMGTPLVAGGMPAEKVVGGIPSKVTNEVSAGQFSHAVNCACAQCACTPCQDPQMSKTTQKTSNIKQMDDATLKRSIQAFNKENCECKHQIEEIKRILEKIRCACTEAELKTTRSQGINSVPAKPFVKQASIFEQTMSGLKMALKNLQDKCKAKDRMIEAMTGELQTRGTNDVMDKVLVTSQNLRTALDYDQACDIKSPDRSHIVTNVIYPPTQLTDTGTAPCDLRCLSSKAVEVRTHKHKKKKEKKVDGGGKKIDCSCSKPQIFQKDERDCIKLDLTGFEVIDIRRITDDSLIVKWTTANNVQIVGYDLFVNGSLTSKVMSGTRTSAMLYSLDLSKSVQITIYAVSRCGRVEPPAIAIYEVKGGR